MNREMVPGTTQNKLFLPANTTKHNYTYLITAAERIRHDNHTLHCACIVCSGLLVENSHTHARTHTHTHAWMHRIYTQKCQFLVQVTTPSIRLVSTRNTAWFKNNRQVSELATFTQYNEILSTLSINNAFSCSELFLQGPRRRSGTTVAHC